MKDFMPPQRRDGDMTVIMLINEVSRLFGSAIRDIDAQDSDMSQESFRFILISLSHTDGVTQLELCRSTHLKAPTISVTLGKRILRTETAPLALIAAAAYHFSDLE